VERHLTILLVEDDFDVREAIVDVLREAGHTVVEAINGADALDKLAVVERPCLILLDLLMPQLDGFGFLQRLKELPHASEFSVLVISAHGKVSAAEHYPGVLGTLRKPFDVEDLLAWVNARC